MDFSQPPDGAWRHTDGTGTVIGATHRSLGAALGSLAFALFWNGIVSVFVLIATASTLQLLGVGVPSGFPPLKMSGGSMGAGMTIFLWLFLTPFLLIGLALIGAFLSSLAGRTEVQISSSEGVIFTGIGPLGWRRQFLINNVKAVRIDDRQWRDSDGDRRRKTNILIETRAGKEIKFGSMLKDERRKFVAAAVRLAVVR